MSVASMGLGQHETRLVRRLTYSVEELAEMLGIGRNQAYSAAKTGQIAGIPALKVGRRIVFAKIAVDRLLGDHVA